MSHKKYNTYKEYTTIDFVEDEYFIRWVKSPDEQSEQFWKMWIAKHPEKRDEMMLAKSILLNLGYKHDPELSEDNYVDMFEGALKRSRTGSGGWFNSVSILPLVLKVAAVVAVVSGLIFSMSNFQLDSDPTLNKPVLLTKENPRGQKTITWLDDGTKVHLNAGSVIKYPGHFSDSARVVYVEGEAYFEVTKDPQRPFIVSTGNVRATVLGTMFNVRAYPDESKISVAVEEGVVRVENEDINGSSFNHILTQNQMTSYDLPSKKSHKKTIDPDDVFAWTEGVISFKKANIEEILKTLERWYGVNIVLNRELNMDRDFTFKYQNKPLEEILKGLGFAFGFQYEINDKKITLY